MATAFAYSTIALPNIPSKFWDNINVEHPTLMKFIEKNETQDGGLNYSPTRIATLDSAGGYYAGTSTSAVTTAAQGNNILAETYNWVYLANPITMLKSDFVVAGESPLVKITAIEAKKYSAKMYHLQLLADGFINGNGTSNKPDGLVQLITPTATYGGVVPADDADWTPQTSTSATVLSGPSLVETMLNTCTWLGDSPDLAPTSRTLYSRCSAIFGAGLTYIAKNDGSATYGLNDLKIRGGKASKPLSIYWDDDIPSNDFWMLDSKNISLKKSSVEFMKVLQPAEVNSALNQYAIQNGGVFSAYLTGATLRRTMGGWTSLSV